MTAPAPLLITCALGIERRALRAGIREGAAGPVALLRTGMGPRAARAAVSVRLAEETFAASPVLVTGFCAGLDPAMRPGDVVVAETTEDDSGQTVCADNGPLLDALELLGVQAHTGPLAGVDHVVRGRAERARLRARGAVAVDMESAAVLAVARAAGGPGPRPVAAVRVIVDAPEHELLRIGTVTGGVTAFRVLSSILPAYLEWHRFLLLSRR